MEENNFKVGAITPMNAYNDLENPVYFFPDPWSDTPSDGNKFDTILYKTISKLVNDNSKKFLFRTFLVFYFILFIILELENHLIT